MAMKPVLLVILLCLCAFTARATDFGDVPASTDVSTLWVPPTRTVNGHALSADVTVTASDIGATTVGGNIFSLTNPSAITFIRINADNTVDALSASDFRTAIGADDNHSITFVVDGAGAELTTGTKNPVKIPFGGTLQGWLLIAKPSGSVTVDIYRAADGAGLPTLSIVGGGGTKPALSSAVENSSISFTSWTSTTLTAKDNLAINVDSATTVTYLALTLYYK